MPRLHDDVNEEWIADKARFIWDGLKSQRLDKPYIREQGKLRPASWSEALDLVAEKINKTAPENIAAIAGDLSSCEAIKALKDLMGAVGSPHLDCRQDGSSFGGARGVRKTYLFNSGITGVDRADAILIIGSNPTPRGAYYQCAHSQGMAR